MNKMNKRKMYAAMRHFTIVFICLLFQNIGRSQEVVHNSFGLTEGLMSQTVYCALQDRDGCGLVQMPE
jgi:hypothetical protein